MAQINWTLQSGMKIEFTVELITKKRNNLDGVIVYTDCCKMTDRVTIDGRYMAGSYQVFDEPQTPKTGSTIYARYGKVGIKKAEFLLIEAAIAEIKATDVWQAKEAKAHQAAIDSKEYDAHAEMMHKAMAE